MLNCIEHEKTFITSGPGRWASGREIMKDYAMESCVPLEKTELGIRGGIENNYKIIFLISLSLTLVAYIAIGKILIGYLMYFVKYSARAHMAKDARACECVSAIRTSAEYFTIHIQ